MTMMIYDNVVVVMNDDCSIEGHPSSDNQTEVRMTPQPRGSQDGHIVAAVSQIISPYSPLSRLGLLFVESILCSLAWSVCSFLYKQINISKLNQVKMIFQQ